jgi:hypothetical protein
MGTKRGIGSIGTAVRALLGIGTFTSAVFPDRPEWWQVRLGLAGMPAAFVAWQFLRARRDPWPARGTAARVVASIALGTVLLGFAPTRPAALLLGGVSLLVATICGYAGCEISAVGNWLLPRDDQVGCVVLSPVAAAERRLWTGYPDFSGLAG